MRNVFALLTVDDDKAIEENCGTIDYLEREFGWLQDSGIELENAVIADDDDEDKRQRYCNYLMQWAMSHGGDGETSSPQSYGEWLLDNMAGTKADKKMSCPYCKTVPEISYACGEYFAQCLCEYPKVPACFHASEKQTIQEWNAWVLSKGK